MKSLPVFAAFLLLVLVINVDNAGASDNIATAGDIVQIAVPAAGLIMTFAYNDEDGRTQFFKAYVTAIAASEALKYTVKERRPNGSEHGFPSGHATSAFAGAAFIQQRYGWESGIPAYLAASFVGYSRVESKNHYWHDVFAGAAIGMATNLIFTTPFKDSAITPVVGRNFNGVLFVKMF